MVPINREAHNTVKVDEDKIEASESREKDLKIKPSLEMPKYLISPEFKGELTFSWYFPYLNKKCSKKPDQRQLKVKAQKETSQKMQNLAQDELFFEAIKE